LKKAADEDEFQRCETRVARAVGSLPDIRATRFSPRLASAGAPPGAARKLQGRGRIGKPGGGVEGGQVRIGAGPQRNIGFLLLGSHVGHHDGSQDTGREAEDPSRGAACTRIARIFGRLPQRGQGGQGHEGGDGPRCRSTSARFF